MKCMTSVALGILCGLFVVSCGGGQPQGSKVDGRVQEGPLFLLMGGFDFADTCELEKGQGSHDVSVYTLPHMNGLLDRVSVRGNGPFEFVISCFTSDRAVTYANSKNLTKRYRSEGNFQSYFDYVKSIWQKSPGRQVFVVGHSYGGWLSMQLAARIPFMYIHGLYTIDPISFKECWFSRLSGCTRAPEDYSIDHLARIKNKTGEWINFYQDRTFFLHSDHIDEADKNIEVQDGHVDIATHRDTWRGIESSVRNRLRSYL